MFMSFLTWWYGKGLAWRAEKILDGVERSIDTFSLGLLVKTWFSPFRQIDAIAVSNVSLEVRIRKFFDKLFSRFIGAFLRTIVMIIGVFFITFKALWGLVLLLLWLVLPVLPLVLVVIFTTGWTPKIVPKIRDDFVTWQKNSSLKKEVKPAKTKKRGWL